MKMFLKSVLVMALIVLGVSQAFAAPKSKIRSKCGGAHGVLGHGSHKQLASCKRASKGIRKKSVNTLCVKFSGKTLCSNYTTSQLVHLCTTLHGCNNTELGKLKAFEAKLASWAHGQLTIAQAKLAEAKVAAITAQNKLAAAQANLKAAEKENKAALAAIKKADLTARQKARALSAAKARLVAANRRLDGARAAIAAANKRITASVNAINAAMRAHNRLVSAANTNLPSGTRIRALSNPPTVAQINALNAQITATISRLTAVGRIVVTPATTRRVQVTAATTRREQIPNSAQRHSKRIPWCCCGSRCYQQWTTYRYRIVTVPATYRTQHVAAVTIPAGPTIARLTRVITNNRLLAAHVTTMNSARSTLRNTTGKILGLTAAQSRAANSHKTANAHYTAAATVLRNARAHQSATGNALTHAHGIVTTRTNVRNMANSVRNWHQRNVNSINSRYQTHLRRMHNINNAMGNYAGIQTHQIQTGGQNAGGLANTRDNRSGRMTPYVGDDCFRLHTDAARKACLLNLKHKAAH